MTESNRADTLTARHQQRTQLTSTVLGAGGLAVGAVSLGLSLADGGLARAAMLTVGGVGGLVAVLALLRLLQMMGRGATERVGDARDALSLLATRYDPLQIRVVPEDEFEAVLAWSESIEPSVHIDPGWLRQRYVVNSGLVQVAERVTAGNASYAAMLILYPLNPRGSELLGDGTIVSGDGILPEHLTPSGTTPHAVYLSMIVADTPYARAFAVGMLSREMGSYIERGVRRLYTKPSTKAGFRLCANYELAPVLAGSPIYGRELSGSPRF